MISAAGILFVCNGNALFLKRSAAGDFPGYWCLPGGKLEGDETAEQAAVREAIEEIGQLPEGDRVAWTRSIKAYPGSGQPTTPTAQPSEDLLPEPVDFTTFIQKVDEQFTPVLDAEHVGYAWAPLNDPPQPLHPGVAVTLARFDMDELGVAKAIAAGELTSPQRYQNMSLFNMRITGTGVAYRRAINEFVYRRPEHYLTDEFLARCNGLPVIMMHPDKAILDSNEYSDRNVGSMFLPYIKGDEVWGIAKIMDDDAIALLLSEKMSTSPSVLLNTSKDSMKTTMEDGSTLLIEGKPTLLDHLAICEQGVWDKGLEPAGIDSAIIRGDSNVTEDEIKAKKDADEAEAKKADADAGQKLDNILACLDSLTKRMDAMDEDEKKKADAAKDDAEAEEKKKADAEAEEKRKSGEPEQLAADKAKKDADDKMMAEKADSAKADAAKAIADAADLAKRIADVEAKLPKEMADADYRALADYQAKADAVFQAHGLHAPRPLDGDTPLSYRKRMAVNLKAHSKTWSGIDVTPIADDAFGIVETQIYADAMAAANNPTDIPEFTLRPVHRVDQATGMRTTSFYGKGTFIGMMKRPSRRVSTFVTRKDH